MNVAFVPFASLFAADDCAIIWGEKESAKRLPSARVSAGERFQLQGVKNIIEL